MHDRDPLNISQSRGDGVPCRRLTSGRVGVRAKYRSRWVVLAEQRAGVGVYSTSVPI